MGRRHGRRYRRRATAYLMVLATTMLVTVIGLSALMAVRIRQRSARLEGDFAAARFYARSAIEMGQLWISLDGNWRTNYGTGLWANQMALGDGEFSLAVTDPNDGDVTNSETDPVVLTGIGYSGDARYMLQVTLQPEWEPLDALNTCLHAGSQVGVGIGAALTVSGAPLSTNSNLLNMGTIDGDVEVASISMSGTITGTVTVPAPAKDLPDAAVFSTYVDLATEIPYPGDITCTVLSPGYNPWGATNPDGVYYIDTGNADLAITDARIHGTLVVDSGIGTVLVDQSALLHPYRTDYPTLIVNGNLMLSLSSAEVELDESYCGVNFNPTGAPYNGTSDVELADVYPNEIQGLVHVTGELTLSESARVNGVILCKGTVDVQGWADEIIHDSSLYDNPPLGYTTVAGMTVVPGTWKQAVD